MTTASVNFNPHLELQSQLMGLEKGSKTAKCLSSFMGMPIGAGYEQTTTWTAFKTAQGTFKIFQVTHHCQDIRDLTFEPHDGTIPFSRFEVIKISNSDGTLTRACLPMIFPHLQEVANFFKNK